MITWMSLYNLSNLPQSCVLLPNLNKNNIFPHTKGKGMRARGGFRFGEQLASGDPLHQCLPKISRACQKGAERLIDTHYFHPRFINRASTLGAFI
jgi:hypothetical protein